MRVDNPNRLFFNPSERKTLASRMTKEGTVVYDVEEGEISGDSASSVELISEEDFNQESRVSRPKSGGGGGAGSRVWMNFPVTRSSNYGPDLYNLAWAQAVQNKPLNNIYSRGFGSAIRSVPLSVDKEGGKKGVDSGKEICSVVIDDSGDEEGGGEKEEGELEEGEIDLESDVVMKADLDFDLPSPSGDELLENELEKGLDEKKSVNEVNEKEPEEKEPKEREIENRVKTISEAIKTVTVNNEEK